ncbi:DUF1996 domain-containing protein [Catellatospora methionotrophica]|uniref:DUF1996 domain-containing protein n=1 Tax=Catellatospora methionotrophica TaxID=121620 RepID=UPI0033F9EB89
MPRNHFPQHRMEPRAMRLLAAVIVLIAATVLATISQVSQAATGDGATPAAEVPAALAAAARIPNDQGPDAECTRPRSPARCHAPTGPPVAGDFIDIRQVAPNVRERRATPQGSAGTFTSLCGRNLNNHRNPDNFIVAPGVSNGAHHTHDYVGNLSADGNSTNESLAAAGTTCRRDDRSTYYWPVLRQRGTVGNDATADGGGNDGNIGRILRPASVRLEFRGNRFAKVAAMPDFIRLITGDAKAVTNGPANAKAQWTCTGFTNRRTTKYPLCPSGSQVQRVLDFPSCWDGVNADSANHRAHAIFPATDGRCPEGTKPIAQLRMTLTYSVPRGRTFALDTFPEQNHNPLTDHADFVNVMPSQLVTFATDCINRGRRC